MIVGIVDSTVVIHLFRREPSALKWYGSLDHPLGVTPITWMEIMYGAGSKLKQEKCQAILRNFNLEYLTPSDQDWAIQQLERYRLSHGTGINDCLIASVCNRLQVSLYTHNLKDMQPLIGAALAIKPY